jgi:hypothetical protein
MKKKKIIYSTVNVYLNKEEAEILAYLCKEIGDSKSSIMRRCLIIYEKLIKKQREKRNADNKDS